MYMKSDRELRETFEVGVEENGFLSMKFFHAEYNDKENTRQAELVRDECLEILRSHPEKKFHVICDVSPMGTKGYVSKPAGTIYRNLASLPQVGKIAVVGNSGFQNIVLDFILFLIRIFKKKISWFNDRAEAVFWLKQADR